MAVCGERQLEDAKRRTLLTPTLIVEVLSDSTEAYDRGEKFAQYQRLESLTDYLLIAQDKRRVEHYIRRGDRQWLLSVTDDLQSVVSVASLDCSLALVDIYVNVEFPR